MVNGQSSLIAIELVYNNVPLHFYSLFVITIIYTIFSINCYC